MQRKWTKTKEKFHECLPFYAVQKIFLTNQSQEFNSFQTDWFGKSIEFTSINIAINIAVNIVINIRSRTSPSAHAPS